MSESPEMRLTSKRVKSETIKRIRIDIPDGCTEDEKEELFRELCIWYNFYNPTAAANDGEPSASEAIKKDVDENGHFFWFNDGYNMHGNDLNTQVYPNVIDTETLSKM